MNDQFPKALSNDNGFIFLRKWDSAIFASEITPLLLEELSQRQWREFYLEERRELGDGYVLACAVAKPPGIMSVPARCMRPKGHSGPHLAGLAGEGIVGWDK